MTLEDFFTCIQKNNIPEDLIIFKNPKSNDFISAQYITEILHQHNLERESIEDLSAVNLMASAFDALVKPTLQVYKVDKFECTNSNLLMAKNLVISCKSIPAATKKIFKDYIIEIPELTDWQLKDYLFTQLDGMTQSNLDAIMQICNKDIYRIQLETERLKIFPSNMRNSLFEKFKADSVYSDLTTNTIFELINAIVHNDAKKAATVYNDLDKLDSSPLGILSLLYNNFRNIILIQLDTTATPESTNINPAQFYAIKHNIGVYTREQLKNIFLLLTDIDRKIKLGELEIDNLLDYLLVNIFAI